MRQLTVGEFLDAVDKNGYKWGRMSLWNAHNGTACVMGQALLNLGYTTDDLVKADGLYNGPRIGNNLSQAVKDVCGGKSLISYNDLEAQSYADVRNYAHERLDLFRDRVIEFEDGR